MGVFTDLPKQILDSLPSSAGYGYIICCIGGLINGATEQQLIAALSCPYSPVFRITNRKSLLASFASSAVRGTSKARSPSSCMVELSRTQCEVLRTDKQVSSLPILLRDRIQRTLNNNVSKELSLRYGKLRWDGSLNIAKCTHIYFSQCQRS